MRRVVITGTGIVSPFGTGVRHNWSRLISGKSGIRKIGYMDVDDLTSQIAGVVPRESHGDTGDHVFHPDDAMAPKDQKKVDTFILYAMKAAREAIADSGWSPETEEDLEKTGVLIGSGIGGLNRINDTALILNEKGTRRVPPFFVPSALINLASGHVSIEFGFKGPNHAVVTACASGTHAIGDAARLIMYGDADVMLAGGAESSIDRLGMAGFAAARSLSTGYNDRPEEASRPFDTDRDGFVISEGAGIVVLEDYEHARKRGANIYAEVTGYGMSGDAYHITSPAEDGNGGYRAMKNALRNARLDVGDIDYINAHGTSTPVGDGIECQAIKRLFNPVLDTLHISSTKSAIGHLLGAAGAVEAIFCLKALQEGILPPTINLHNPSEECKGMDLIPGEAREKPVKTALSNSFGFGGTNACIIFRKI